MSIEEGMPEFDHGARRLQGEMLDHPSLAIDRMPGLSFALNRFIAEAPARLASLIARALGEALEAAFASVARVALSFERLTTIKDPFALGRRDGEAAAARFTLGMNGGACEGLLLLPQAFLLPFRAELANDPETEALPADRRWSRLMEAGIQQTRLPVTAILEEVPMSLGDVANFEIGGLLPLQCNDFTAIRLECSGRGMFTCKLGQADGRYRLEVESPIAPRHQAAKP